MPLVLCVYLCPNGAVNLGIQELYVFLFSFTVHTQKILKNLRLPVISAYHLHMHILYYMLFKCTSHIK